MDIILDYMQGENLISTSMSCLMNWANRRYIDHETFPSSKTHDDTLVTNEHFQMVLTTTTNRIYRSVDELATLTFSHGITIFLIFLLKCGILLCGLGLIV